MSECLYTAQGELVCREHFVRSGTREPLTFEGFAEGGGINMRPNEGSYEGLISEAVLKKAIDMGCKVNVEKDKGYSISDCKGGFANMN